MKKKKKKNLSTYFTENAFLNQINQYHVNNQAVITHLYLGALNITVHKDITVYDRHRYVDL